jgi:hypothetical protein
MYRSGARFAHDRQYLDLTLRDLDQAAQGRGAVKGIALGNELSGTTLYYFADPLSQDLLLAA